MRFEREVDLIVRRRAEVDDDGIGLDLGLDVRVVVAQQSVDAAVRSDRLRREPLAEVDRDPEFREDLQIGRRVHRTDVDSDRPLGTDVGDLLAVAGQMLHGVESRIEPVIVVDEDPLLVPETVIHHIPDVEGRALLTEGIAGIGDAPGGDDDDVRGQREDVVSLGEGVHAQVDPVLGALLNPPIDDADEIPATLRAGRDADLPAGCGIGLEQGHAVAADGGDAGGFETGRTCADDDDVLRARVRARVGGDIVRDLLRQIGFSTAGRVVDAGGRAGGVDAVEAHVRPHTGTDIVLPVLSDLLHQVRVGQLCPGHAHEIEAAVLDGIAGRGHIGDPGRVEHGDLDGLADAPAGLKPGGRGSAHAGDRLGEFPVAADRADVEVEKVDSVGGVLLEHIDGQAFADAAGHLLEHRHPQPEGEITGRLADGIDDAQREAHPMREVAAVLVVALIEPFGEEVVDEVAGMEDLEAVEPGLPHAPGRRGEVGDDPVDVELLHRLGERAVAGLPVAARGDDRQPVGGEVRIPRPEVGQLDHHRGAFGVAVIGDGGEPRDHLVGGEVDVAEGRRRVLRHDRRPRGHGQSDAAARLLPVVEAVAVLGHAVLGVGRLVCGGHDAVAQGERAQLEGLEQGID